MTQTHNNSMAFDIEDLNNGDKKAQDYKHNDIVIYTGKKKRVYNYISDTYKVDIKNGDRLYVCKNQYVNCESFNCKDVLKCHFKLVGNGHGKNCNCGSCGYVWHFEEDDCNCDIQKPIHAKDEACCIQ